MQLLAWPNADVIDFTFRRNRSRHIDQSHARDLRNKNLTAVHAFQAMNDEFHALLEGEPKSRHTRISNGNPSTLALFLKYRDHAAPAAHHVSVAGATETSILRSGVSVRLHEHFFRAEFRCSVKINRID